MHQFSSNTLTCSYKHHPKHILQQKEQNGDFLKNYPSHQCFPVPLVTCPFQSYLTVDITQTHMYQEGERTPDDESSLTFRNKGKRVHSSRRPITQKQRINKANVAIVVGAVLIVSFLVYQLSAVGSKKAVIATNVSCTEAEEALKKEQEKVKSMMVTIDSLRSELSASKEFVSSQQSAEEPPTKNGPASHPSATSSAVSAKQMKPGYVSKGAKGAPAHLENPNVVIDINYPQKDYLPIPIDFFRKNSEGKTLAEVLYADAEQRKKREDYQKERISFLDGKSNYPQIFLTKYNMPLTEAAAKEGRDENVKEWVRLNTKFGFDKVKKELPMCIMVPGYNNNANFRIEYNLNSIFSQNYSNYKVVVIDDKSTDGSGAAYSNYFAFNRIDKSRYTFIQNSKRVTALQNIYMASLNHCGEDSIVVTLDADDEFIGRNVLQVFNWGYQIKKSGVLYTNFMWYQHRATLMYGFTSDYAQTVKKNNAFRTTPMQFSHLRSYRNELIGQIDPKDLQDDKGVFFTITYDIALFIPLMELSCGRVHKIEGEYHYLYNTGTGLNDYNDRGRQVQVENQVRGRKKYECYKNFDRRMSQ